jgi:hypothetical protein
MRLKSACESLVSPPVQIFVSECEFRMIAFSLSGGLCI